MTPFTRETDCWFNSFKCFNNVVIFCDICCRLTLRYRELFEILRSTPGYNAIIFFDFPIARSAIFLLPVVQSFFAMLNLTLNCW